MTEQLLEKRPETTVPTRITIPTLEILPRPVTPAVFRRQERFWTEVRKKIQENNPAVQNDGDRYY